jgi:hypothetical protein
MYHVPIGRLIAGGSRRLAAQGICPVCDLIGVLNHGVESYEHFMYIAESKAWYSKSEAAVVTASIPIRCRDSSFFHPNTFGIQDCRLKCKDELV